MNDEEKKPSLADIYRLGNNLQYCRLKAISVTYNNQKVYVKGKESIVDILETINNTLKQYNLTLLVQKDIQRWIKSLNDAYILGERAGIITEYV